ncbi:MAG: insulinase family protein [Myxococcota bacterium]
MAVRDVDAGLLRAVIAEPDWTEAVDETLPNGLRIVAIPAPHAKVVRAELFLPRRWKRGLEVGLDWWAWKASWTKWRRSAVGGLTQRHDYRSWNAWSARLESPNLARVAELLEHYVRGQKLDWRYVKLTSKASGSPRPSQAAAAVHDAAFAPRVPQTWNARAEAARWLDKEQLLDHLAQMVRPRGALVVITGPEPAVRMKQQVERRLRRWKGPTEARAPLPEGVLAPPARIVETIADPRLPSQSHVVVSCRLAERTGPRVELVAAVVKERLWADLRDTRGWTYGVSSWVESERGGGRLVVSTRVQRDATGQAAAEVLDTLRTLADEGPTPTELERGQLAIASKFADDLQTSGQVVDHVGERLLGGGSLDEPLHASLLGVEASDIARLLAKCPKREVVTVVGDPSVAEFLEEAGVRSGD